MGVELLGVFGDDLMVVNAARVSFGKQKFSLDKSDEKLIQYLAAHGHWSPFSHPQIQFRFEMPFFLVRQWWTHKVGFTRNEVSRRYVDLPFQAWTPTYWRKRNPQAKQGSLIEPIEKQDVANYVYQQVLEHATVGYKNLLELGVCPEQARAILPVAGMTQFIETGSLYAYARLCRLRLAPDAQEETRSLSQQVADQLRNRFPLSWAALMGSNESAKG